MQIVHQFLSLTNTAAAAAADACCHYVADVIGRKSRSYNACKLVAFSQLLPTAL